MSTYASNDSEITQNVEKACSHMSKSSFKLRYDGQKSTI